MLFVSRIKIEIMTWYPIIIEQTEKYYKSIQMTYYKVKFLDVIPLDNKLYFFPNCFFYDACLNYVLTKKQMPFVY
jgi:hypothetical protein